MPWPFHHPRRLALLGVLTLLLLGACGKAPEAGYEPALGTPERATTRVYRVGIHPLHNPQRLVEVYGPIVEAVNAVIPDVDFQLEASRNYEEFERKLYGGEFDFAMPNPYQTVLALRKGYHVIGKMADDGEFRGIILVRKDSGIQSVRDLKGKSVAYPAPTALAATLLPQQYLHAHGLNVNSDITNLYVGSQESSILNVQRGHVVAAATWPLPWKTFSVEKPELANQLEVKWQTEPLVNNGWVARRDLAPELVQRFMQTLVGLKDDEAGRQMLSRLPVSAFEPATDETYRPVQRFIDNFARQVRPIEH